MHSKKVQGPSDVKQQANHCRLFPKALSVSTTQTDRTERHSEAAEELMISTFLSFSEPSVRRMPFCMWRYRTFCMADMSHFMTYSTCVNDNINNEIKLQWHSGVFSIVRLFEPNPQSPSVSSALTKYTNENENKGIKKSHSMLT